MTDNKDNPSDNVRKLVEEAWADRREKRHEAAHQKLNQAIALCRQAGLQRELVVALGKLGHVELDVKNIDAALAAYKEAVKISEELDDSQMIAHTVRHLGDVYRHGKRFQEAEGCYHRALEIYTSFKNLHPCEYANAIRPMAIIKEDLGHFDEAKKLWEQARELYGKAGIQEGVDECSERLAGSDRPFLMR